MENKSNNLGENELSFLLTLYKITGGEPRETASANHVLKTIGIDNKELGAIIKPLIIEGLINATGILDRIQLTHLGKTQVESKIRGSFSATKKNKVYSIFISHIHENEVIAKELKKYFIDLFQDEIDVFISGDPDNVPAGQDWFVTIIEGIKDCDCMIILCTPDSVERKWIHFEAGAATVLDRKIIPICFAGLSVGALPSPLSYIRSQAIDADDADRLKKHFEKLIVEINQYTSGDGPMLDVLRSNFYQELQFANPRFKRFDSTILRTF